MTNAPDGLRFWSTLLGRAPGRAQRGTLVLSQHGGFAAVLALSLPAAFGLVLVSRLRADLGGRLSLALAGWELLRGEEDASLLRAKRSGW